jgi:hypothetical protein
MGTYRSEDGWTLGELEKLGVTELHLTSDATWEGETADHLLSCSDPDCGDPAHR